MYAIRSYYARVTYVRDALHESLAIIPTRQLVSSQIVNYTKENKLVPAVVKVGVSYLNNPRQVASILVKVGKRGMKEIVDVKGRHLVRQNRITSYNVCYTKLLRIVIVANITVFAIVITFGAVNLAVIVMRYTEPELERKFKVPIV